MSADRGDAFPSPAPPAPGLPEAWADQVLPFLFPESSPGPGPFYSIAREGVSVVASVAALTPCQAMLCCLGHGIWPQRFKSNRGFFTACQQARLLRSRAAIIGCGGLGGHAALLLARLGIGALTLCDMDRFEESNLNRQAFCREDRLGMHKALAAAEDIQLVASHIDIRVHTEIADSESLPHILKDADAAVDCLDSIPARKILEQAAQARGIPFIHGAIAGTEGFALAGFSQKEKGQPEGAIARLYGDADIPKTESAEYRLGVPGPTPMATAVMQVMLLARVLTGQATDADKRLWHLDLAVPELELLQY